MKRCIVYVTRFLKEKMMFKGLFQNRAACDLIRKDAWQFLKWGVRAAQMILNFPCPEGVLRCGDFKSLSGKLKFEFVFQVEF